LSANATSRHPRVSSPARIRLLANTSLGDGAPAKHQTAITTSQMAHPAEDVGRNGTIGFPNRWCTTSHIVCNTHPRPMNRYECKPLYAHTVTTAVKTNSH